MSTCHCALIPKFWGAIVLLHKSVGSILGTPKHQGAIVLRPSDLVVPGTTGCHGFVFLIAPGVRVPWSWGPLVVGVLLPWGPQDVKIPFYFTVLLPYYEYVILFYLAPVYLRFYL